MMLLQIIENQQQDVNTLLLIVLTILMIGRAIDKYFDNTKK
ncbi:hypothetical protein SAMN05421682_102296 [Chryseobacterium indoltheticum]|uniref:Uncharacterized protein n=1 Tax=Chryseobacterium indoltheticum TaxID=254 RepID=A0A381FGB9_9FLAO|nr:hypothetical protein SAMN05421682_102296 [Chryseobacterium indoltheticum]SUX45567.1 Uncharacterised protein [Chryseobacterium indoltheticum]